MFLHHWLTSFTSVTAYLPPFLFPAEASLSSYYCSHRKHIGFDVKKRSSLNSNTEYDEPVVLIFLISKMMDNSYPMGLRELRTIVGSLQEEVVL